MGVYSPHAPTAHHRRRTCSGDPTRDPALGELQVGFAIESQSALILRPPYQENFMAIEFSNGMQ